MFANTQKYIASKKFLELVGIICKTEYEKNFNFKYF